MDSTVGPGACGPHQDRGAAAKDFVKVRDVAVRDGAIRLAQLLKLSGIAQSGGEAKAILEHGVLVNGVPEARRGRQLVAGDLVEVAGETLRVVLR
jgi:ribosome-associated protein